MASSRAHLFRPVTDAEGNVTPNTKVTIYEKGSTQLLQQSIYDSPNGSVTLTNPFTTSSGFVDFYLAAPQSVAIGLAVATQGGKERRVEDIPVLPPSDQLVRSPVGFQIMNSPIGGGFLQASEDRKAYWTKADDIVATHATPTVLLKEYDFSASYLDDLAVVSGANAFVDVALDVKPSGYGFLQALGLTGKISAPLLNFRERGWVSFAYKVVSSRAGQDAARLKVSMDNETVWVQTPLSPEFVGSWAIGILEVMKPGSHRVSFEHIAGSDPNSRVLLGPVKISYGNNIPAHDHAGSYEGSLCLGTDAAVSGLRASALGARTRAGEDATATGWRATAGLRGVALGSAAQAAQDSLAAGFQASATGGTNAVALGSLATSSSDDATAAGYTAQALAARALALGAQARAGGAESIAVGAGAKAAGYRAVAIGADASAPYPYSLALGPGVVAQAEREARLGDEQTVIVIPGVLRHTGPRVVLGSPGSKIGFYGAAPVERPIVRGSRAGNQVLTQTLQALHVMGLIEDRSTAT